MAPPGLRRMGDCAFSRCKDLRRVVLNKGFERLVPDGGREKEYGSRMTMCGTDHVSFSPYRGFFCGSGLEEAVLPSTLKCVSPDAFGGCGSLRAVLVQGGCPADVRGSVCLSVAVVVLPSRDVVVGGMPLWDVRALRDVVIPDGVEAVGERWFCGSSVESVTIPASVEEVGPYAFCDCRRLAKLVFGGASRLKTIGLRAFQDCSSLGSVLLPDGLRTIGSLCFYRSGLEAVVLPASVREVGVGAFCGCEKLKSAQLNEGLEELGVRETIDGKEYEGTAFAESAIESVILPSTLKRVEA